MPSITTLKLASLIILGTIVCSCQPETTIEATTIDLSGQWLVKLDDSELQKNLQTIATELDGIDIKLPGTLDEAGLGNANTLEPALNNYILSHLARKNEYIGQAWYQRNFQLPSNWEGNRYILELERVLWESTLWVNGGKIGQQNSLIAPHRYNITEALQAGKNTITICIDNSDQLPGINVTSDRYPGATSGEMAHAYTNHTQIKWNGIIGKIQIHKVGSAQLENLQVYDNLAGNLLEFTCDGVDLSTLKYEVQHQGSLLQEGSLDVIKVGNLYRGQIGMEAPVLAWDEFSPNLYTLTLKTESGESISTNFGFSNISNQDGELHHNGRRIYLRGTLECAIFPLTGRPYTDKAEWKKMIQSAKAYGLNHLRFHSWCPPKAAFEAADEMGFYLQAELPHWNLEVGKDPVTNTFLRAEGDRILREYGNHPSFILMSMGNELQGDLGFLNQITSELKAKDSRRLYSTTTFSFQEGAGSIPQPEDEFYVTQWTDKGWVRGQGIFNDKAPHFDKDYTKEMEHLQLPLISHEIGQYSVFPDLSEIEKYTGVLEPLNFIAVQQDLAKKGLADQAADFTLASGKLATILYKEEIERALKTPGFDGFQLLQLQDFPGQGTALVGLLNAFWESKGAVDSATFKQFCGPVVPLLRFEKAVYPSGATFQADVQIANFWKEQKGLSLKWHVKNKDQVVTEGRLENIDLSLGNGNYPGFINPVLEVEEASQLTVGLEIEGTDYKNEWKVWVYPDLKPSTSNILYTRSFTEAQQALAAGKTVLLNPDYAQLSGVTGRFVPVFWSPVHFPNQPSTMGILCDPDHPALADFPTDIHTDWQWWDLNKQSKAIVLDSIGVDPIVRVIDNFVTNRSLGNIFEAKVGNGKLLFTSIDLQTNLENRLVARQLRKSLMDYMQSGAFQPSEALDFAQIDDLRE